MARLITWACSGDGIPKMLMVTCGTGAMAGRSGTGSTATASELSCVDVHGEPAGRQATTGAWPASYSSTGLSAVPVPV